MTGPSKWHYISILLVCSNNVIFFIFLDSMFANFDFTLFPGNFYLFQATCFQITNAYTRTNVLNLTCWLPKCSQPIEKPGHYQARQFYHLLPSPTMEDRHSSLIISQGVDKRRKGAWEENLSCGSLCIYANTHKDKYMLFTLEPH